MLTILITFRKIYFFTNFLNFCREFFLRKMAKIKHFQVRMPIDWKLNNELNGVWISSFWLIFLLWQPKNWIFMAKKGLKYLSKIQISDFCQKCDIFSFLIIILPALHISLIQHTPGWQKVLGNRSTFYSIIKDKHRWLALNLFVGPLRFVRFTSLR